MKVDPRFDVFLFVRISRVENDSQLTYMFTKPYAPKEFSHPYSADKAKMENCYDKLKPGHHYIVMIKDFTYRGHHHVLWEKCVEIPTAKMWLAVYQTWQGALNKAKQQNIPLTREDNSDLLTVACRQHGVFDYWERQQEQKQKQKDVVSEVFGMK